MGPHFGGVQVDTGSYGSSEAKRAGSGWNGVQITMDPTDPQGRNVLDRGGRDIGTYV